jgi:hypothetical protein
MVLLLIRIFIMSVLLAIFSKTGIPIKRLS